MGVLFVVGSFFSMPTIAPPTTTLFMSANRDVTQHECRRGNGIEVRKGGAGLTSSPPNHPIPQTRYRRGSPHQQQQS